MATGEQGQVTRRWARAKVTPTEAIGSVALLLLAVALAARALYYVTMTLPMIRWSFGSTGGEATMLHEAGLLNGGLFAGLRAIYGPQPADAFIAGNYPPGYLLLWALKPGAGGYATGRALSLLWGLLAAVAGGATAYAALGERGTRLSRGAAAILGGSAFICTVPVFQQIGIAKPDMMALGLAACGLLLFERAQGRRGIVAAGLCFALALLTKQSIGFTLAAASIAAWRRGPRAAFPLVATVVATGAVVVGGLWLVAGPTVLERLIVYNLRDWRGDRFDSLNGKFLRLHWPLLVPALGYGAWGLRARARSALTYYPFTALAALLTVGSEGGARNYYVELCLAAGLGAALALGAILGARPVWALPLGTATALLLAFYTVQTYTVFVTGKYVPEPPIENTDRLNRVLRLADAAPDPILSDEAGYLAMRGRTVVIDDDFLCETLRRKGLWSNAGIVAAIEARRYPLVLVSRSRTEQELRRTWGDEAVDALYANYERAGPESFVPKPR